MTEQTHSSNYAGGALNRGEMDLGEMSAILIRNWKLVLGAPVAAAVLALGVSYLIPPTFSARTTFLPPQQTQSSASSALASLGALAGVAGGIKSNADQYVALLQSRTVADRMIDRFDLMRVYDEELRVDARLKLTRNTRTSLGKKDGIITVETDDTDPQRAMEMANAYIEELRKLTARLALTEAQQRRMFFEGQLQQVKADLAQAQQRLQASGFSAGAIKAEPKATAESFAKLKADATAATVRLQILRRSLAEGTPEVQQQTAALNALQAELDRMSRADGPDQKDGYVTAYRDYKYQEALFELISKQYEHARVDESRDGGQLQVIDQAQKPERKSKPKRSMFMLAAFGATFVLVCGLLIGRRALASAQK